MLLSDLGEVDSWESFALFFGSALAKLPKPVEELISGQRAPIRVVLGTPLPHLFILVRVSREPMPEGILFLNLHSEEGTSLLEPVHVVLR